MSRPQKKKSTQTVSTAKPRAGKGGGTFAEVFFAQIPAEDLSVWSAADLGHIAASMKDWAQDRKPGTHKIRVFNPDKKRDGWSTGSTVIQIVNDDMPFIIDSVSAELTYQGMTTDHLLHPILNAKRAASGKLSEIKPGKAEEAGFVTESHVHLQLEQTLSAEACRKLADALDKVLSDVRLATSDWRRMMKKIDDILSDGFGKGFGAEYVEESADFLKYIKNHNFTLLGYCEYRFSNRKDGVSSSVVEGSDLGVLRGDETLRFGTGVNSPEIAALEQSHWPVMISKLIDHYATVHRRVPMDTVCVKIIGRDGKLAGMHLFVGLFTSSTYSCRTSEVPVVRRKVARTIQRAGFISGSHDAKSLEHILEKMPRDELFQASGNDVYDLAMGILRLQARQRIALFTHMDPMRQYMSCLVYVPRDRYNTRFRLQAVRIIEHGFRGRVVNYFTTLDDSPLARVLFTVTMDDAAHTPDQAYIEAQLIELGREWDERLRQVLVAAHGKARGAELSFIYGRAFPGSYHESIHIGNAVHDVRHLELLAKSDDSIRVDFYRLQDMTSDELRVKVYHKNTPVPLSDILPVLGNMGLKSVSEMPYEVKPFGYDGSIWIHDFLLTGAENADIDAIKTNVEEAFLNVWRGLAENDTLNQLVISASLTWRQVMMLRTYSAFLRQGRFPYSAVYMSQVLDAYPAITRALVELFETLHDPRGKKAKGHAAAVGERIIELLQDVQKLDHDRIFRSFKGLIENTLRTSYFQTDANGQPKSCLAVKINSKNVADLPLPRPYVEIFVYSRRVEAVHLRGGEIARGGIRWSDRHDDFRTEILGLLKSQMVKNTVIVPVGAKGGFIVKQPPKEGGREAFQAEGIECYKIFVQELLDLTDNNVKGKMIRPKDVVCHDGIDPYLVVAADKGTATFSDIANSLSLKAGFWMGDAFASGGSAGYDHKKMGITARGGWESVKRHFREMGKDIQKEAFTAIGVGDMAGDVFGNAMLLSKQTRLIAAFNHVHIFIDPEPDAEKSYAERQRLFKARGGWDAYDKDAISAGGGVFDRAAKSIRLSASARKALGVSQEQWAPDDLIREILKMDVELLWFGGIGTFLKSSRQSHADADDKSNDNIRVDARDVRARVVGEGANLGVTQLARIEYAQKGGRINTDFIDNSAGVDCSDHEVNIKILLSDIMASTKMTLAQRNKLLQEMTDDVARLVLADNYQQTQSLSLQEMRAPGDIDMHLDMVRTLEKQGLIRRTLEGLPDDETFARLARDGLGLTRPELAVLTSNAKIVIYNRVLASDIPDNPALEGLLFDYFPKALRKYEKQIRNHKLRREIIATQVVNVLVNRMGPVFVGSRMAKTGEPLEEVVKAFLIVVEAYGMNDLWQKIENLDNKVPNQVQLSAMHETFLVVKRAVTWFLRFGGDNLDIKAEVEAFLPGIATLRKSIRQMLPETDKAAIRQTETAMTEWGMPAAIASDIAVIKLLSSASDIVSISRRTQIDVTDIAPAYFTAGARLGLDWLRHQVAGIVPANAWQARVMGGLMDDFYIHQASLTSTIFASFGRKARVDKKSIDEWFDRNAEMVGKITQLVEELKVQPKVEIEMLVLVSQRIGQMVHVAK